MTSPENVGPIRQALAQLGQRLSKPFDSVSAISGTAMKARSASTDRLPQVYNKDWRDYFNRINSGKQAKCLTREAISRGCSVAF